MSYQTSLPLPLQLKKTTFMRVTSLNSCNYCSCIKYVSISAVRQRVVRHTELPVPKRVSFGEPSLPPATPQIKNTPRQILRPLPRPMIKKERTILDKLIDYLVDDGPSNRYALICKRCNGHNGKCYFQDNRL